MKRTRVLIRLIPAIAFLPVLGQDAPVPPGTDLAVRTIRVASGGALCVGGRNALQVEVRAHGAVPRGPVPIRLVMYVPGGDLIGIVLAEGSLQFAPGASVASFTFLNVEVPARMRGRGARLEARANVDRGQGEADFSNNVRALALDTATDWDCRR